MSPRVIGRTASLAAVLLLNGCSTIGSKIENDEGEHNWGTPYSGTRQMSYYAQCVGYVSRFYPLVGVVGLPIILIELPLSLTADTILLPIDLVTGEPEKAKPLGCNIH